MIEAMELVFELRQLADKFSEGWHDGIKIDASDIMLLSQSASFIEAIAEAEKQEPVATVTSETGADITMSWWHEPALPIGTKLYTHPQPKREQDGDCQQCGGKGCVACDARKQEPVMWVMPDGKTVDKWGLQFYGGQTGKPLYAQPPKREWVEIEKSDMPDGDDPMFDHLYFLKGMVYASEVLKRKNT